MKRYQRNIAAYGEWAVVTGASDGIGRAVARDIAAAGVHTVLVARREDRLEALANELRRESGVETRVVAVDLAERAGVQRVIEDTADLDVGILVAAAGYGTSGAFVSADVETERNMIAVNCTAVMEMSHHYARRFASRHRGAIVLFSSIVAFQGVANAAHYAATKAYIQSLAEGLRIELRGSGVDVLSSAPATVDTGFAGRADMNATGATPEAVSRGTVRALGRGRGNRRRVPTTVRPGALAKALAAALTLPRWGRTRALTLVMAGMTKHQRQ